MKPASLSEAGLIRRLAKGFSRNGDIIKGIGDDCAVIRVAKDKYLLVTIDMLVEDVHFKLKDATPFQIGWKSLGCGISDIASMGGLSRYAVVSLGLPARCSVEFVEELYRGMKVLGRRFGVTIIGGDTNRSEKLVVDAAVMGFVEPRNLILRSGAKTGDIICVTGTLGGSYKSGRHLDFTPRQKEARILTENFRINSMIDISDGLSTDLNHIAEESGVGACIYEALIPISKNAASLDAALNEGEDFELLFTLPVNEAEKLLGKRSAGIKTPITKIGKITAGRQGVKIIGRNGKIKELRPEGFKHF